MLLIEKSIRSLEILKTILVSLGNVKDIKNKTNLLNNSKHHVINHPMSNFGHFSFHFLRKRLLIKKSRRWLEFLILDSDTSNTLLS